MPRAKTAWTLFRDELPEEGADLVAWANGTFVAGAFNGDVSFDGSGQIPQPYYTFHATHWMIPEGPDGT